MTSCGAVIIKPNASITGGHIAEGRGPRRKHWGPSKITGSSD